MAKFHWRIALTTASTHPSNKRGPHLQRLGFDRATARATGAASNASCRKRMQCGPQSLVTFRWLDYT